ncbi:MAG TPA: oligosaccharide flippase family protein, partial [Candidatus Avibacteroides faecavium]|nr:oligosaccharide flippase family protein [Candidatus Avibacteroides faecavium]
MKNSLVPTSEVLRPILTLGIGAVIAQLIPFVMSFVLARLYTPDDFGELGLFINYAGILLILASARYELAIVRARSDIEANAVAVLSVCLALAFCLLLWLVVGVADLLPPNYVSRIPGRHVLPAFVLFAALMQVQLGVRNYQERYKSITVLTVSRNVVQALSRLLLSLAHWLNGLVWGTLAGVVGAFALSLRGFGTMWRGMSVRRLAVAARRYANF